MLGQAGSSSVQRFHCLPDGCTLAYKLRRGPFGIQQVGDGDIVFRSVAVRPREIDLVGNGALRRQRSRVNAVAMLQDPGDVVEVQTGGNLVQLDVGGTEAGIPEVVVSAKSRC